MIEEEARRLLRQVGQQYIVPQIAADEFTCQQFADENHVTYNRAKVAIERALAAGSIVEAGTRKVANRTVRAYRIVSASTI